MPRNQDNLVFKNELAVTEIIKKFRHEYSWLQEVKSKPQWVGNDVIKIPVRGAAPKVLIDNTIYPINSAQREDGKVVITLHKYETENTEVTAEELYALPYEKVSDVQTQHRETLEDVTAEHALYSIAPQENTAKTPVLKTTGSDDGTGRKRLIAKDVIKLKKALDKVGVPKMGRVLVLCSDHATDLLLEDLTFNTRYQNTTTGKITDNYYGFKVYESGYAPTFNNGQKEAYDATALGKEVSIAFHNKRTVKAPGTVERYAVDKKNNPKWRRHEIGFEVHWVCVAIQDEGLGAIESGTV